MFESETGASIRKFEKTRFKRGERVGLYKAQQFLIRISKVSAIEPSIRLITRRQTSLELAGPKNFQAENSFFLQLKI